MFTLKLGVVDWSFEGNDGEQLSGSMSGGNGILMQMLNQRNFCFCLQIMLFMVNARRQVAIQWIL